MATAAAVNQFLGATFPRSRNSNSWDRSVCTQGFLCDPVAEDLSLVKVVYRHGDGHADTSLQQEKVERAHWLRQYQEVLERRYDVQFANNDGELVLVVSDRAAVPAVKQEQGAQ